MAKVYLICGKICSGKSFFAKQMIEREGAVNLSCDEVTYDLFNNNLGQQHDEMTKRIRDYLQKKAVEIVRNNGNVILDWGFWTKQGRREITQYFKTNHIDCQWHYIDVSDEEWERNIKERNAKVLAGESTDYYVDEGLLNKLNSIFEAPDKEEIDCWHCSESR